MVPAGGSTIERFGGAIEGCGGLQAMVERRQRCAGLLGAFRSITTLLRCGGKGVFVAAMIYTNANGVLNDDGHEYKAEAEPFLANLGEVVGHRLLVGLDAAPPREPAAGSGIRLHA